MHLSEALDRNGIARVDLERFLAVLGASTAESINEMDGVRPFVLRVTAGGETHRYRVHDVRVLAARC